MLIPVVRLNDNCMSLTWYHEVDSSYVSRPHCSHTIMRVVNNGQLGWTFIRLQTYLTLPFAVTASDSAGRIGMMLLFWCLLGPGGYGSYRSHFGSRRVKLARLLLVCCRDSSHIQAGTWIRYTSCRDRSIVSVLPRQHVTSSRDLSVVHLLPGQECCLSAAGTAVISYRVRSIIIISLLPRQQENSIFSK